MDTAGKVFSLIQISYSYITNKLNYLTLNLNHKYTLIALKLINFVSYLNIYLVNIKHFVQH